MTASRYPADPARISVAADDGTVAGYGTPRVCVPLPAAMTYTVREGDRVDLLAAAALNDSTAWWRIGDANPWADPLTMTNPATTIAIPGAP